MMPSVVENKGFNTILSHCHRQMAAAILKWHLVEVLSVHFLQK